MSTDKSIRAKILRTPVPFNFATVEKAHDVRTLTVCSHCNGIGNKPRMVPLDDSIYHGRCFIAVYGMKGLLALPKSKQGVLCLDDIGVNAMKAVMAQWTR